MEGQRKEIQPLPPHAGSQCEIAMIVTPISMSITGKVTPFCRDRNPPLLGHFLLNSTQSKTLLLK